MDNSKLLAIGLGVGLSWWVLSKGKVMAAAPPTTTTAPTTTPTTATTTGPIPPGTILSRQVSDADTDSPVVGPGESRAAVPDSQRERERLDTGQRFDDPGSGDFVCPF